MGFGGQVGIACGLGERGRNNTGVCGGGKKISVQCHSR